MSDPDRGRTANDNGTDWDLRGPDAEGDVWMVFSDGSAGEMKNLGAFDGVAVKLADWLAEQDFGER